MKVAVVGGGIAGLAAAHELASHEEVEVTLVEADDRLGGKIRTADFAGTRLDVGADSFLARRPEAVELCRQLGLDGQLVAPATTAAWSWWRGRLRRLPPGLVLGVPTDLLGLASSQLLSPPGWVRVTMEPLIPGQPLAAGADASLGSVVRRRLGHQAHTRLVDPLVGSINAGDTDYLSIEAVAPLLADAARRGRSLVAGAKAVQTGTDSSAPLFLAPQRCMGALVEALASKLDEVRTGDPVEALSERWTLHLRSGEDMDADGVILAVPAFAAASLLASLDHKAASLLGRVAHASVVMVCLSYAPDDVSHPLNGSGFLVPRREGRLMTACSFASSKWPHLADSPSRPVLCRVSAGRHRDGRAMTMDDAELVDRIHHELAEAIGLAGPPSAAMVTRWPDAFPQYAPGHLRLMAAVEASLGRHCPGLALAGAALGGIGVPACVGSGQRAARAVLAGMRG